MRTILRRYLEPVMLHRAHLSLAAVLLLMWTSTGYATTRNVGKATTPVFAGHDLTPVSMGPRVLYAPSESDDPTYRMYIAERLGGVCDYFDARFATPEPELLATYDCVHTWSNYPYFAPTLFGDRLADFADKDGTVILGAFSTSQAGNSLGGRIVDPVSGLLRLESLGTSAQLNAWDGTCRENCIYRDVPGLFASHRQIVTVTDPSTTIVCGNYLDGEILVAHTLNQRVYFINGAGGFPMFANFYMAWAVANACSCNHVVPVDRHDWSFIKRLYH